MASRYSIPVPLPAPGQSKVSHALGFSQQERLSFCLTFFTFFTACLASLLLLVSLIASPGGFHPSPAEYHGRDGLSRPSDVSPTTPEPLSSSWACYSPYHPAGRYDGTTREGCVVSQVNILQRHGARYPTSGATVEILEALRKLQTATSYDDPRLYFLKKYTYELGVDDLVKFGADQSYALGEQTFKRYQNLIAESDGLPFVRAAGSERVVFSAQNWTLGFSTASKQTYPAEVNLVIPEMSNNTLANKMCPAAASPRQEMKAFINTAAAPIAARLNSVAPGANLDPLEAHAIMHICPFETAAKERPSPFCSIFTKQDFEIYEYASDLEKFYNTGYGASLGAIQGVGYINELIGRLTNSPPHHGLQTNKTLLSSERTFPLNRSLYVDFSHDNLMVAVFTAIGLFNQTNGPLDPTKITKDRTWIISEIVPFSGHMTVERLSCSVPPQPLAASRSQPMKWWNWMTINEGADYERQEKEEYVRIFVNDVRQPLHFCGAGEDGMCKLDDFVTSQEYARNDGFGDFERCGYVGS